VCRRGNGAAPRSGRTGRARLRARSGRGSDRPRSGWSCSCVFADDRGAVGREAVRALDQRGELRLEVVQAALLGTRAGARSISVTRSVQSSSCGGCGRAAAGCRSIERTTIQPLRSSDPWRGAGPRRAARTPARVVLHDGEAVVSHRADLRAVLVDEVGAARRRLLGAACDGEQGRATDEAAGGSGAVNSCSSAQAREVLVVPAELDQVALAAESGAPGPGRGDGLRGAALETDRGAVAVVEQRAVERDLAQEVQR
jgi:hypothetical protein